MNVNQRQAQLYGAFLKTIRSVGTDKLKQTTMFVRNVDAEEREEAQAA